MRRAPAWRRPDGSRRPGHHEAEAVACPRRARRQPGRPTWQGKPSRPEVPANWPEHSDIPARSSFAYPAFSPVIPSPAVTDLPNRQGPCLRNPSGRMSRTSHKCRFRLTYRISPQTRHISLYRSLRRTSRGASGRPRRAGTGDRQPWGHRAPDPISGPPGITVGWTPVTR